MDEIYFEMLKPLDIVGLSWLTLHYLLEFGDRTCELADWSGGSHYYKRDRRVSRKLLSGC